MELRSLPHQNTTGRCKAIANQLEFQRRGEVRKKVRAKTRLFEDNQRNEKYEMQASTRQQRMGY
jgi:hypothetical protein